MCDVDLGGEHAEVFWEKPVKAGRRRHDCDACGAKISVGEPSTVYAYVFDGFHSERACAACQSAIEEFARQHGGWRWFPRGLIDALEACGEEGEEGSGLWNNLAARLRARATLK